MNILSVVNVPEELWEPLRRQHPAVTVRTELDPARLDAYADWADVAFGNVPPAWALKTKRGTTYRLRWLQSVSAGLDAYQSLLGTGIRLTSARGVHHQSIAHHVVMSILALNRQLPQHLREQGNGTWNRQPHAITSVVGQRVGMVGYGGIGEHLTPLAVALGMHVVGVARSVAEPTRRQGAALWPMSRLDELLQTADHVVLCLPLTPATAGFMNEARLRRMKTEACLHNVARGELLDEAALGRVLGEGHLAGAALDVFCQEPLPADHPLRHHPRVIVTPHIAGHYRGLREATFRLFSDNLGRFLAGQPLLNEVVSFNAYPQTHDPL